MAQNRDFEGRILKDGLRRYSQTRPDGRRAKTKTEHFHTVLAATVVAPGHNRAVPLEPEFIRAARRA